MNTPKFLYKLDVGKGDKPINGADSMHLHSTETVFLFLKITIFRKKGNFILAKHHFQQNQDTYMFRLTTLNNYKVKPGGHILIYSYCTKLALRLAWKIKCFWFWV